MIVLLVNTLFQHFGWSSFRLLSLMWSPRRPFLPTCPSPLRGHLGVWWNTDTLYSSSKWRCLVKHWNDMSLITMKISDGSCEIHSYGLWFCRTCRLERDTGRRMETAV